MILWMSHLHTHTHTHICTYMCICIYFTNMAISVYVTNLWNSPTNRGCNMELQRVARGQQLGPGVWHWCYHLLGQLHHHASHLVKFVAWDDNRSSLIRTWLCGIITLGTQPITIPRGLPSSPSSPRRRPRHPPKLPLRQPGSLSPGP